MHINGWVHASDLMKMMKSANSTSTFSSEEGLPDNHVITIRERELTVDFPELIQNNIKTDTVTLDLDTEWDGIHPVIIFGPNASGTIAVEYTGEPVHIPGAVMQYVGGLDCSVMGLDDSGEVRLVTKAAPNTFEVVESGEYIGQISEDDVSLLGQILSAIEDVETATSDASSAAEAATAAANSANTAATKATNAANSANTASERAENAYDALTPIIAEIGVNGNQPRATTNPNHVATASDAYAAKPLGISIKGATRQNLWVNPSGTINGVTVTANDDGSITLSGTATQRAVFILKSYTLRPGSTYTVESDKKVSDSWVAGEAGAGAGFGVVYRNAENVSQGQTLFGYGSELVKTFAVPSAATYVDFDVIVEEGFTVSGTYRVMLNEGSTAQPWCPPGLNSVDELSIVTAGKNLLVQQETLPVALPYARNGITFSDNGDGGIRISGTATDGAYYNFYATGNYPHLPPGTYTASTGLTVGGIQLSVGYFDPTSSYGYRTVHSVFIEPKTFKLDSPKTMRVFIAVPQWTTVDTVMYPQIELGSKFTGFESFSASTTTTIDLDGHTLCSLPDGTCDELTIDATGAVTLTKRTWSDVFDGTENWQDDTSRYGLNTGATFATTDDTVIRDKQLADTLPVIDAISNSNGIRTYSSRWVGASIATKLGDLAGFKTWLGKNNTTLIYKLAEPETIPLPAVTLPTLPSPNITVYHDSDVPSDITVEYVQDINIVLDNLNAKIAALNVAQSSSS